MSSSSGAPSVSIEQGQAIVDKHFSDKGLPATIVNFTQVKQGYSFSPGLTTYLLDLALSSNAEPTHSSFLVLSDTHPAQPSESYSPNPLSIFPQLISTIRTNTSIPIPDPTLDTSHAIVHYTYLITPIYPLTSTHLVSLAYARSAQLLTPPQQALIDLQLGQYLGELHKGAQNDWFGLPVPTPPADPSYDWQETFTALLEALLDAAPASANLPLVALRSALARAIAAFLFADVAVPSLVWFTGSSDDVFLAFTPAGEFSAFAILPAVAHAMWGDPLIESFFVDASDAFWEGYRAVRGAEEGTLIAFPRQRTKRLWYDVFLALVVLRERRGLDDGKVEWAEETLRKSAELLRDAPCY
ncbi:hypothetical protein DFH07DRAFT_922655 [Mycena maculata]|uniref:Aminoglycoside phosphotransferase domain-containing protein n=1 Tax=Mycena maculata TaxID=230809 RepID=A0AAD7IVZ5_9AGAR|nr:hypothetical protein DFH07DRAFT_922655 [Mycena maculata]